jgi:OmpA-OmpF porin, OOP family
MRVRTLAGVALALAACPRLARADTASPGVAFAPAGDRALSVGGADARGEATFRARAALDHARAPVTLLAANQDEIAVVSEQLWVSLGASFALSQRVLFAFELPLLVLSDGETPPAGSGLEAAGGGGLGDVRLLSRARLLGAADAPQKLGAGLELRLPTASRAWAGDPGIGVRPFVALSAEGKRARAGAELGLLFAPSVTLRGLLPVRTGSAITAGLAASVAVDRGAELGVGPELSGRFVFGGDAKLFDPRSSSGHALLALRYAPGLGPFVVSLAFGPGFGQGVGAADLRVLTAFAFSPEAPPPPPDRDADRVADAHDACPSVSGAASEDPMMNGCPELPSDGDGDAIPDMLDACPKQAGPANAERRLHGCPPAADTDGDRVRDPIDACPEQAGVASADPRRHGCPPPEAKLEASQIVISEQVQFETGTAELRPESSAILDEVRRVLERHADIERVEIQGHTDATGSAETNRKLSEERARAVLDWLVARGVSASRLVARGYGPDRPLADNALEAGRAQNRRVEFHVVAVEPGAPP